MKEVTESEFLEAYRNLDNTRIMNKVCSRYRNTIPHDEIERCKLVALWEAMKAFDPNGGRKFTSFLYNRIDWECKKEIQRINRHKKRTAFFIDGQPEGSHTPDYRNLRSYETVNMEEAIETLVPKYKNIWEKINE